MAKFLSEELQQFRCDYFIKKELINDCDEELRSITSYLHDLTDFLKNYSDESMGFRNMFIKFVSDHVADSEEAHRNFIFLGVICLKLFTQANWTGPPLDVDTETLGILSDLMNSKELNDLSVTILEANGDEIYQLIQYPVLLLISYMIFVESSEKLVLFTNLPILAVKCFSMYCHIVDETKESHLAIFQNIIDKVDKNASSVIMELSKDMKAEFYMTCFHLYLRFYNYKKAEEYLEHARKLLDIEVSLTSSLGKRTKFQQKALPFMKLNVMTGENREDLNKVTDAKDLPNDVLLDNDTLLPHIKFIDDETIKKLNLSPIDQAYILCCCVYHQKTKPRDDLTSEELLPYLDACLMSPQSWSVQLKALFLRCITEMHSFRKMERALTQLESVVNTYKKPTPLFIERNPYLYAIDLNPQYINARNHGQVAFAFGCVDTALEIFLKLCLWEDCILCYQRLGRHGEAETMIRKQLEIRETATLWCLLGDVTLDDQYYHKAWEFSKHRSVRSQRSLGQWHLRKQEFKEAIPYFQKSLELNCLQPGIAFSLGCSCMAVKDLQVAAKAFQSCVSLDPDNHEAWCNLAANFIRLNHMDKAHKALLEATRLSYDNWKIWENFLLVATDVGAFYDSIRALHRLIDIKRKTIDVEVLHILNKAVMEDLPDHRGTKASTYKPKLFKLYGHITSQITSDPNVWELYAILCLHENDSTRNEQALDFLYKSLRCYTQNTVWEKNEKEVKHVMRVSYKVMDVTKSNCEASDVKEKSLTWAYTTKMSISNLVIRLQKAYCDNDGNPFESIKPDIDELQEMVNEIQTLIAKYESGVCNDMC